MSDTSKSPAPGAATEAPKFTERELQILGWAMQSLKSGPPEIDYEKLAAFASMTNPRSASNAWAAIKKKLTTSADGAVPPTPKKAGGRKKKEDDGDATPKTPRKRAIKQPEDGDASPKKRGRPSKAKPKPEPEEEDSKVKPEPDSADELHPESDATVADAEEEI
ncbi:hypothetical protein C7974DRAFT_471038 [Boeremia exigua]|uniref:uncharacterized protein n=1 Tax=Boeremia exigua TaxID=749465 RepID=UPI001E8D9BC0|nr:uncharacterized protein C7974DRAFT_471038 [Boeremia exigua]KAH6638323.1 hypothetical protein C7974DRAFT_471038 [Boeremia exigua]